MINFRHVKCFQAVAELGSFSRAAERLNASQAGVSHAIRELEEIVGARLFDRTTRRVDLTEAGRIFGAGALPGLVEIERAVEAVRDLGQLKRGLVRIAAPPLLGATVLPRLLNEIGAAHPNLQIRIEDIPTEAIAPRVRSGLCDLGVGTFGAAEEGLDLLRVARDQLMVFVDTNHAFRTLESVRWSALQNEQIIALSRESNIRGLTELGFEATGLPLRPQFEVHQVTTALALVESGVGAAVLPTYAYAASNARRIIARPLIEPAITRDVCLITARERSASPPTVAVIGILRRVIREMVPEIPGETSDPVVQMERQS